MCRWLVHSSSGRKPERDSFENAFYRHLSTTWNTAHLTFHSTRIRREYPRLSRPNQTSNHSARLAQNTLIALTHYKLLRNNIAVLHVCIFFFYRDTEIAYSYNVLAYFVICVLLPAFPSSFRLKIVSEEQYFFATHNYR